MKQGILVSILICLGLMPIKAYSLEAVEVFTGYLEAEIRDKDDYTGIPLLISFNFDAKPAFDKLGIDPAGELNFIVEPFINTIISPDLNVELGSNFLIKYSFPLTSRIHPYAKGGLGMLLMTQHTREQSTQYNFLPQAGGGLHFFLNENIALSCEYRYRHLSNASFKHPNKGIDANLLLGGVSYFF